jgi:hypothetical protein
LKRANAVAVHEKACGMRFRAGKANQLFSGFPCIQREIASEEARFSLTDTEVDTWNIPDDGIQSPDMVYMSVRQDDAPDGCPETSSSFPYAWRCACHAGVDESEAIVFTDQEAIDHAEASQAKQVFGFLL